MDNCAGKNEDRLERNHELINDGGPYSPDQFDEILKSHLQISSKNKELLRKVK